MVKVAEARYTGRTRAFSRRGPSGETYIFPKRTAEDPWIPIENVADARRLEDQTRNVDVKWTGRGRLLAYGKGVLEQGYQAKRSLASELDLDFDGQPDEETLDASIQTHIDELEDSGEL